MQMETMELKATDVNDREYDKDFVICEVEIGEKVETHSEDSKHVTNRIKPVRKLERKEVLALIDKA